MSVDRGCFAFRVQLGRRFGCGWKWNANRKKAVYPCAQRSRAKLHKGIKELKGKKNQEAVIKQVNPNPKCNRSLQSEVVYSTVTMTAQVKEGLLKLYISLVDLWEPFTSKRLKGKQKWDAANSRKVAVLGNAAWNYK